MTKPSSRTATYLCNLSLIARRCKEYIMRDKELNSKSSVHKMGKRYTYEEVEEVANYLKEKVAVEPRIGIICGSGIGSIGEILTKTTTLDYKDIPNFPTSTVMGHAGRLLFGNIGNTPIMCMQGRFHYYEGNSLSRCSMPVRVMKLLGVKTLIASNAAGSVNPSYKTGDIMLIKDHINFLGFSGHSPLRGPNEDQFGPRFIALNSSYNPKMIKQAHALAEKLHLGDALHEGVYACVGGPAYETVAEMKALKLLGVDAVGMSTVHEVITARHCGMDCFAFSLITNEGVMDYDTDAKPDGDDIVVVADKRTDDLKSFVKGLVTAFAEQGQENK